LNREDVSDEKETRKRGRIVRVPRGSLMSVNVIQGRET
jgi:hypothetical protein